MREISMEDFLVFFFPHVFYSIFFWKWRCYLVLIILCVNKEQGIDCVDFFSGVSCKEKKDEYLIEWLTANSCVLFDNLTMPFFFLVTKRNSSMREGS